MIARQYKLKALAAVAGLVGLMTPLASQAVVAIPISTFYFSANCVDCATEADTPAFPVVATLVLQNYLLGSSIDENNFVSLTYSGSNLVDPFSLSFGGDDGNAATRDFDAATTMLMAGSMNPQVSGESSFLVVFDDGLHFRAQGDGSFTLCAPKGTVYYGGVDCNLGFLNTDHGVGVWSETAPVPEPATYGLMALGLAGLGLRRRRS